MLKLRMQITKGEEIRYISHLDYARAIERAIRRAKLPVAYSEGFNPHMKLAFASALGVGIASETEYVDVEFKAEGNLSDIISALAAALPQGIALKKAKFVEASSPALMSVVNQAQYRIVVPLLQGDDKQVQQGIDTFNQAQHAIYIRQSPKGRKEIDVKCYVPDGITAAVVSPDKLELSFATAITPGGSVKPSEVLSVLADNFAVPVMKENALIQRTGLYVADKQLLLSPLDVS